MTPKIRAAIQASTEPAWLVAEHYGISEQTVWKWRSRDDVHDSSHTPYRLQTTLTPAQEAVPVALRKALLLPLDDLLAVMRDFLNPHVSRSGLDRCLRRHGVSSLQALKPKEPKPAHGRFKADEPGYLHIDIKYLPQMADEDRRRYLVVAIDRAARWIFVRIYPAQTAANARRFLRDLERAAPMKVCIDPVKICSCYKGERSDEHDDGREHQTVDGEAEDGVGHRDYPRQDDSGEAPRSFDLSPSEIEGWVEDAKRGMENSLRANPLDIRGQYEKQLKDLQEAYGEAMLELRARESWRPSWSGRTAIDPDAP